MMDDLIDMLDALPTEEQDAYIQFFIAHIHTMRQIADNHDTIVEFQYLTNPGVRIH